MTIHLQKKKLPKMCEYIKNRLYFLTLSYKPLPRSTARFHFFSIDNELVYANFYSDFGPLNLGSLYKYCVKLNTKLSHPSLSSKVIVHCTTCNPQKRANAAFLIASFAVLFLNMTPRQALKPLVSERLPFLAFQDVVIGKSNYTISLVDCLNGLYRAMTFGFFHFADFDLEEYEQYSICQNGDLNWIVPQKFLAFSDPFDSRSQRRPETYINYFRFNNVTTIIRLNKKTYDAYRFVKAGFRHYDLYMLDGTAPPQPITRKFLYISENTDGAVAVHCKAGLGRTGSLIGAYLMKHYQMTAKEAIAWLRICRPGSVIGYQQAWLEAVQPHLWKAGEIFRLKRYNDRNRFPIHPYGVYSIQAKRITIMQYDAIMNGRKGSLGKWLMESPERTLRASGDTSCLVNRLLNGFPTVTKTTEGECRKNVQKARRYTDSHGDGNMHLSKAEPQPSPLNRSPAQEHPNSNIKLNKPIPCCLFPNSNAAPQHPKRKLLWRKQCIVRPMTTQCKENEAAGKATNGAAITKKSITHLTQGDRLYAIKAQQVNSIKKGQK